MPNPRKTSYALRWIIKLPSTVFSNDISSFLSPYFLTLSIGGSAIVIVATCHTMLLYVYWFRIKNVKWKTGNKANLKDLIAATGLVISNWIQIVNFSARVTVKFDGWPCKTIGHLFYATSSFVHHFVAIGEFKLELQSGNAQSGSNSTIFRAVWPWNLTDDLEKQ